MDTNIIRRGAVVTLITAGLLVAGTVTPAIAAYPSGGATGVAAFQHGSVLQIGTTVNGYHQVVQETNEFVGSSYRAAVLSPNTGLDHSWWLVEVTSTPGCFRLLSVATGNALMFASVSGSPQLMTAPAEWNLTTTEWCPSTERGILTIANAGYDEQYLSATRVVYHAIPQVTWAGLRSISTESGNGDVAWDIQSRDIVRLTINSGQVLQETNEAYEHSSAARNVVVSRNQTIDYSKWRIEYLDGGYIRFINVATGNALQVTLEQNGDLAYGYGQAHYVVTTPASWNSLYQQWRIVQSEGSGASITKIVNRATGEALYATPSGYRGIPDTQWAGAHPTGAELPADLSGNWTVTYLP